jgi:hypothetical protein
MLFQWFTGFSTLFSSLSMFHRLFQALPPANNEKRRETRFHAVEQCFTGFPTVSGEKKSFQAAVE